MREGNRSMRTAMRRYLSIGTMFVDDNDPMVGARKTNVNTIR